jgi:hypothetical protein
MFARLEAAVVALAKRRSVGMDVPCTPPRQQCDGAAGDAARPGLAARAARRVRTTCRRVIAMLLVLLTDVFVLPVCVLYILATRLCGSLWSGVLRLLASLRARVAAVGAPLRTLRRTAPRRGPPSPASSPDEDSSNTACDAAVRSPVAFPRSVAEQCQTAGAAAAVSPTPVAAPAPSPAAIPDTVAAVQVNTVEPSEEVPATTATPSSITEVGAEDACRGL